MTLNLRPIAFAAMTLLAGLAVNAAAQDVRRPYIVQLQDQPAATYTGGIDGLAATQPEAGVAFEVQSPQVQDYLRYLGSRKADVLATIASAPVIAQYDVVLNGFAAMLTDAEVLSLKANAAVADVQADAERHVDTISTPRFLGLSASGGLWSQFAAGSPVKGENIVIGIIDGGIWPENPAFADRVDSNGVPSFKNTDVLAFGPPPSSFKGGCVAGEGFDPALHCNNKLIGAKFYNAGFLANNLPKNWSEFYSPRDSNIGNNGTSTGHGGHGDHTASTAAGNANNPVVLGGVPMGLASGIAPRARVAAYKICWTYDNAGATDGSGATNSCFNSDAVLAIDEAVKDGVNVLNYSISGSQNSVADPVEQAFYRAALANVFVAASAGNSGPTQAVAHISPWLTTVAASTHDRNLQADATTGAGATYSGASLSPTAIAQTSTVLADNAGAGGGNANLCYSSAAPAGQVLLDPAKVNGKIVVCTRGGNARVDKSFAVQQAGGIGMIMIDNGSGIVAETHSVPTVHLTAADGALVKKYVAEAGAAATTSISAVYAGIKAAPYMIAFSSRGPNGGDGNLLKPDLTAPGVDIIASVSPPLTPAQHAAVANGTLVPSGYFDTYSGTSMSSPHVAGLAMLLKQAHPTWTPAAIKSALMTTAYTTLDDGLAGMQNGLLPWSQGAGHVAPNKATDPGLVYDAVKADYVGYQCKVNRAAITGVSAATVNDCNGSLTLDETYNFNVPSITVGSYLTSTVVKRRVTNVGASSATYTSNASLQGFTTVVTPPSLTLAPGASANFTVTLTKASAVPETWYYGSLVWTDGNHIVKSPIQAKIGKPIAAPSDLTSDKATGSKLFTVKTNFSGRMTALKGGLKDVTMGAPVTLVANSNVDLEAVCRAGVDTASVKVYPMTIPSGTIVARFAIRQADVSGATDDNDLVLLAPDGSTLAYPGLTRSNESAQLSSPAAGQYKVCITAYGAATGASTHQLSSWIVTPSDVGGNLLTALPSKVVAGNNATVSMSWSGLGDNKRVMGGAQFLDLSGNVQAVTVLRIETGAASVPAAEVNREASKFKN